ncbi:hypothetical protein LEM8419_03567 [Neolewinella maritima]|uniref:Uncharacterized protein n=1 Tax=Neolewinella maritima TaxID=1383882 RepID=A0ABN8FEN3_9BACT|nr:hypothetical protein LEM8419_03567 [Neolewinella maritima]
MAMPLSEYAALLRYEVKRAKDMEAARAEAQRRAKR